MDATGLESAKRTLFIALAADMVVTAAAAISDLWAIGILEGVRAGTSVVDQATISNLAFWDKFAFLALATWIGVGVTLVQWLGATYQYARATLGATGFVQEKWKSWGWIGPFLNLFKPYQVLSEIYKAGNPGYVGDDWKKSSGSGLLLIWWIFWVITHLMMYGIGRSLMRGNYQDDLSLSQGIDGLHGSLILGVISLTVAGLWYVVAGSLTNRLLNRSVGFSGDASRAGVVDFVDTAPNDGNTAMTAKAAIDEETVYAQIAKEIETGLVDQGLWTRLLARTDGDEKRTKVLYIKQRAERLLGPKATPAPDTQRKPIIEVDPPRATGLSAPAWAAIVIGGVVVLGIVAAVALPAMQGKSNAQTRPAKNGAFSYEDAVVNQQAQITNLTCSVISPENISYQYSFSFDPVKTTLFWVEGKREFVVDRNSSSELWGTNKGQFRDFQHDATYFNYNRVTGAVEVGYLQKRSLEDITNCKNKQSWGCDDLRVLVEKSEIGKCAVVSRIVDSQIDPKDPLGLFAKPNFDSEGWTQDSTGSTEVGPWLKYDPPGTRYWRDANRIIYRVFPPGTKPNAEKANPFGLDTSEDFPR